MFDLVYFLYTTGRTVKSVSVVRNYYRMLQRIILNNKNYFFRFTASCVTQCILKTIFKNYNDILVQQRILNLSIIAQMVAILFVIIETGSGKKVEFMFYSVRPRIQFVQNKIIINAIKL